MDRAPFLNTVKVARCHPRDWRSCRFRCSEPVLQGHRAVDAFERVERDIGILVLVATAKPGRHLAQLDPIMGQAERHGVAPVVTRLGKRREILEIIAPVPFDPELPVEAVDLVPGKGGAQLQGPVGIDVVAQIGDAGSGEF